MFNVVCSVHSIMHEGLPELLFVNMIFIWPPLVAQTLKNLLQCRRPGFDSWVRKIPWRRIWQPTPVFLPEESHGQRSLAGYSPRGRKESDTTEQLKGSSRVSLPAAPQENHAWNCGYEQRDFMIKLTKKN